MLDRYRAFYEAKALSYPDEDPTARARYQCALGLAAPEHGQRILDVGCKDAMLYRMLPQGEKLKYTGADISHRVIDKNREDYPEAEFIAGDVCEGLPIEAGTIDRMYALEILEHLPDPMALLKEARRVLAPDGLFCVSVPNPYYYMEVINELRGYPDTEGHLYGFTEASIRALLDHAGLEVEERAGTYLQVPKRLRGAFRKGAFWLIPKVPALLARSRIYRCRVRD